VVTVRRAEVMPWAIPLAAPIVTARGAIRERRGCLVVLEADGGLRGLGEAAPHPAAPARAFDDTRAALAVALRDVVGGDAERLLAARCSDDRPAAAGIDVALHDLLGRATERPVCELLGGARRALVAASALVSGAEDARSAVARGFACAKVKVGPDARQVGARVAAVRTVAPALVLRADANGVWDADTAVRVARALVPYGLEWLEQPVAAEDVAGLGRVRRDGGVAVAADESVTGVAAVEALATAVDAVVLKVVQVGGLCAARRAAARAAALGLAVAVTTSFDTGVGTAAALHLATALPEPLRACGVATGGLLAGDLVRETIADGPWMRRPDGPGLGLTLDPARLARWRLRDVA
jgi:o-succinylbenzoate synthase